MADTKIVSKKPSTNRGLEYHREHCPCKGQPQQETARLRGRKNEVPAANTTKTLYNTPGSQNRKK